MCHMLALLLMFTMPWCFCDCLLLRRDLGLAVHRWWASLIRAGKRAVLSGSVMELGSVFAAM